MPLEINDSPYWPGTQEMYAFFRLPKIAPRFINIELINEIKKQAADAKLDEIKLN